MSLHSKYGIRVYAILLIGGMVIGKTQQEIEYDQLGRTEISCCFKSIILVEKYRSGSSAIDKFGVC